MDCSAKGDNERLRKATSIYYHQPRALNLPATEGGDVVPGLNILSKYFEQAMGGVHEITKSY